MFHRFIDADLAAEFDRLENEIGVLRALRELHAYKKVGEVAKSKQLILQMAKGTGDLTVHEFDTSAFRNYFTNVEEFLDLIERLGLRLPCVAHGLGLQA